MNCNNNRVELIGTYGGDMTHALSAWTSTSRELSDEKLSRVPNLLKMLADNGHGTPFEKSAIHFLVTTDLNTHIHLLKHRIGVPINAESARYKELREDKLYVPFDWPDDMRVQYIEHMERCYHMYHTTLNDLISRGFNRKRAKESARFYLPCGNQIAADVMFNWRSFDHFLKLRYSSHAQREVCRIARMMLELVVQCGDFDQTLRAFGYTDDVGNIREQFED